MPDKSTLCVSGSGSSCNVEVASTFDQSVKFSVSWPVHEMSEYGVEGTCVARMGLYPL